MSFIRFHSRGSEVYVYPDVDGYHRCCGCWIDGDFCTPSASVMVGHLRGHQARGYIVPEIAIRRLLKYGDVVVPTRRQQDQHTVDTAGPTRRVERPCRGR